MKRVITIFWMTAIAMTISACSSMNGSFDCPNKAGVNCRSLDQVNDMVDSGQLHGRSSYSNQDEPSSNSTEFEAFPSATTYTPGAPLRYGETVQRIWVAPYEDTEGNYHQDNLMYAIVKRGHWIGAPLKPNTAI